MDTRQISPQQMEMLLDLMELEFTAVELNLYLDTHPEDMRALDLFNRTQRELAAVKNEYVRLYGPLTNFGNCASLDGWTWIDGPWPWQINYPMPRRD
jgi:spore coat protein JB